MRCDKGGRGWAEGRLKGWTLGQRGGDCQWSWTKGELMSADWCPPPGNKPLPPPPPSSILPPRAPPPSHQHPSRQINTPLVHQAPGSRVSSVRNQGLPTGRGFIKCQRAVREQQGKWGGRGGLAPETKGKRHLRLPRGSARESAVWGKLQTLAVVGPCVFSAA